MRILTFILFILSFQISVAQSLPEITLEKSSYFFSDVAGEITITDPFVHDGVGLIYIDGEAYETYFSDGKTTIEYIFEESGQQKIEILYLDKKFESNINVIPLWLSILPPLLAIIMALIFKEVIIALVFGVFAGAATIGWYTEGFTGIGKGFLSVLDTYIINSLIDWGHGAIILFTFIIGGMVAIISKNGGMQGVVNLFAKKAQNPKGGMLTTWFLGLAIFFDDYANTLVVGNTMRPLTDKLKISREKLAYLVDSTAAPVAALAFITTWIGAELSYIQNGMDKIEGLAANESAYGIFFNSLAYSFYPIFTLFFMLWMILKQRDFGPMLKAEQKARTQEKNTEDLNDNEDNEFKIKAGVNPNIWFAVIPVFTVVIATAAGLYHTGSQGYTWSAELSFFRNLSAIVGNADSFYALLWGSITSLFVAVLMSILGKKLKLGETMETLVEGLKTMLPAIIILILAWALANITEVMHTADFITGLLRENVSIILFPTLTFILAGAVSFATGSSWGTMAILYPLLLPASWKLGLDSGYEYAALIGLFSNTAASVLCGSVFGDHCSPISDTTILSSIATNCNHINHVKTQMPYALTTGLVSIIFGSLASSLGLPPVLCFLLGFGAIVLIVLKFAKPISN